MFDLSLFQSLHAYAGLSGWIDGLGIFLARYLPLLVIAVAALFIVRAKDWRARWQRFSLPTLATIAAWGVATPLIRLFYDRPRPPEILDITSLIPLPESGSMPSGHAAFFFALALAIFFLNRRWGTVFLAAAVLIALARVFVGVHWPTDVLAGAALGIAGAYLANYLLQRKQETGTGREELGTSN